MPWSPTPKARAIHPPRGSKDRAGRQDDDPQNQRRAFPVVEERQLPRQP